MKLAFYIAKNGKILDKLISWWTGSIFSHVELVFSDGTSFSASIRDKGTRFKKIDFKDKRWKFININTLDEEKIYNDCLDEIGKGYDVRSIFLTHFLRFRLEDRRKWNCFELCHDILTRNNLLNSPYKASQVGPIEFFNLVEKKQ